MANQYSADRPTRRRLLKTAVVGLTGPLGAGVFGSAAAQKSNAAANSDPIVIKEPITITESGTYLLENDLKHDNTEESEQSDRVPFIKIDENITGKVIIDGQDQKITGQESGTGILALKTDEGEVTVRNLTFCNLQRGVDFEIAGSLALEDVTITKCTSAISYHDNNQLTGNDLTITENQLGIDSTESGVTLTGSTIADNETSGLHVTRPDISDTTISRNGTGVAVYSGNGTITDCNIQYNDGNGIETADSSVTVTDSQISQNGRHGIHVLFGTDWKIYQNTINQNEKYGVYIEGSNTTQVIDNTIVRNAAGPIFASDDSRWNIVVANQTEGEYSLDRGDGDDNGNDDEKTTGTTRDKRDRRQLPNDRVISL